MAIRRPFVVYFIQSDHSVRKMAKRANFNADKLHLLPAVAFLELLLRRLVNDLSLRLCGPVRPRIPNLEELELEFWEVLFLNCPLKNFTVNNTRTTAQKDRYSRDRVPSQTTTYPAISLFSRISIRTE